jgi:signal transduction histidine kinase
MDRRLNMVSGQDDERPQEIRAMLRASRLLTEAAHQQARAAVDRARHQRSGLHNPRVNELACALDASRDALTGSQQALAAVSHELRQAIGAAIAARGVLRSSAATAAAERAGSILDRQLDLMRRLVDDLTDMSRLTFDRTTLNVRRVTIQEIVQAAIDSVKPITDGYGHELRVSMPNDAIAIEADPVRLQQVFSNLLTNAASYTPPRGRLGVDVRASRDTVSIVVRDNGHGIAPELLTTMFEPFKRGPETQRGLGLGLAIASGLVRLHRGTIDAHSDGVGHGSEFVVTLPVASDLAGA